MVWSSEWSCLQTSYATLRDKLKPGMWYWDKALDSAFEESKATTLTMVRGGIRAYEPNRPTCICTDWFKKRLGFTLLQKYCRCQMFKAPYCWNDGWQIIFPGSRFTTFAVEGEELAIAYALEKSRIFLLGCSDLITTIDHILLVKILGIANMDTIKDPWLFQP